MPDGDNLLNFMRTIIDPATRKDIVAANLVQSAGVEHGEAIIVLQGEASSEMEKLRKIIEKKTRTLKTIKSVSVIVTAERAPSSPNMPQRQTREKLSFPNIKSIIAIASGKGGVGKSTVAVNLALAMAQPDKKIGLLDADIYGPSQPRLLGLSGKPDLNNDRKIVPLEKFGLKVISIGLLAENEAPMIWRGPMVQTAILQMTRDVAWGELDCLVIDLPPGTGDAQLTMAQQIPLTGAIIVSTPQDLSLIDARKGLQMFQKLDVPVLGIIENMSYFTCPHCSVRSDIFSHGGAKQEAEKLNVPFLGEIPLNMELREASDDGAPLTILHPDSEIARIFSFMAQTVLAHVN